MRLPLAALLFLGPPAFAADGALLAQACLGCHGPGNAGAASTPPLSGRPAAELAAQMQAFRSGERPGTIMGRIARGYAAAETAAVAAYLAQGTPEAGR